MKISIAMATYNGAKYLKEQLDSFVEQTRQPDELIVYDDRSSDETVCILRSFKEQAPFPVDFFVNEKNLGYAQNFGRCLSLCTGSLVFLSDQDDVWFPNKIELIEKAAEQDDYTQLFMNDTKLVYEDLTPTGLTKLGQIRSAKISEKSFVMGCCAAVRQKFLGQLLPIPPLFPAHDSWIVGFADGLGRKTIIDEPLQFYRRHKSNTSQFVANRTVKISKYDRLLSQVRKAWSDPGYTNFNQSIANLGHFIDRAESWAKHSEDKKLQEDLLAFIEKTERMKNLIAASMEIRKRCRLSRVLYAARLLHAGGYKERGGIQCYLRDVLF